MFSNRFHLYFQSCLQCNTDIKTTVSYFQKDANCSLNSPSFVKANHLGNKETSDFYSITSKHQEHHPKPLQLFHVHSNDFCYSHCWHTPEGPCVCSKCCFAWQMCCTIWFYIGFKAIIKSTHLALMPNHPCCLMPQGSGCLWDPSSLLLPAAACCWGLKIFRNGHRAS